MEYLVQVHTIKNGKSTMKWVVPVIFDKQTKAEKYVKRFNAIAEFVGICKKAVYCGQVTRAIEAAHGITGEQK
jgi:hypothetical protein